MMCLKKFKTVLVLGVATLLPIQAMSEPLVMGGASSNRTAIFGGLDAGLASLSVSKSTGEIDKTGFQLGAKGLASFYFEDPFVLDAGLGWSYTSLSGKKDGVSEKNTLRNGFLEISPRYRPSRWQIGPFLDLGFGADLTFHQPYQEEKTMGLYPGIQALHEIPGETSLVRVGARLGTDLSIPNRNLWVGQVSIQFGWPVPAPRKTPAPVESPLVTSMSEPLRAAEDLSALPPAQSLEEQIEIKVIGNSMVQVELSREVTNFGTNSANLSPKATEFLRRLGAFLALRPGDWTTVGVEGHTDSRGTLEYNMKLSRRRALSAKKALVEGGVPKERFELLGYGPKVPIDPRNNTEAWAKNRRVEVRIDGAIDTPMMIREIGKIREDVARKYPGHYVEQVATQKKSAKAKKFAKTSKSKKAAKARAAVKAPAKKKKLTPLARSEQQITQLSE